MTITTSQFIAINTGILANDGTGDDLRTAFTRVNETFTDIVDVGFDAGNIRVTGAVEVTGNVSASSISVTSLSGNLTTSAQPAITSVGTLTGVTSSGIVHVTNTTPTTVFNNGALVVSGGVGVDGDLRISGNLYVSNTVQTSASTLVSTSPLVYFDTIPAYPYNFDLGFYSQFTGAVGNVTQHTGFVRNDADHKWYLFSNVSPAVITTQIAVTGGGVKYDTLVLGNIEIAAPTPTAITNGGTTATGNIGASGATFNYGYFTNLTGTLQTASQPNITSASALTTAGALATVGTITTGTWSGLFGAVSGANLTVLTAGNLIGTISSTVMGNSTVYLGTTAIALNRTSAIQSLTGISIDGSAGSVAASAITGTTLPTAIVNSNLQSLGTLSSLTVGGTIAPAANNTINIGAIGTTFATVFATTFSGVSTTAKYADLAENYLSDSNYAAGTVVVFGGAQEITTTTLFADAAVAGVISTNPAYLMNDALDGQPVALRGRVPVQVQGFTRKGDLLVTSSVAGVAISIGRDTRYGAAVFAKALEHKTTADVGIIEAVII